MVHDQRIKAYILAIAITFPQIALAQLNEQELAKCAVIDGDLARLECFDSLAKTNGLDGPQPQSVDIEGEGEWMVEIDKNPIDDTVTVNLGLFAEAGTNMWQQKVVFLARCKSNKTDVIINWKVYLGSEVDILTRIGTQTAQTNRWIISSNNEAAFHPKPIEFLKDMMQSNKLVAQVTPYGENTVTAVFDTTGLSNAIAPLRETCHW